MKRSLLAAAAALLMATTTSNAASANDPGVVTLLNSGYWRTFYTTTVQEGRPMCGMQSDFGRNGVIEGSLMIKYAKGDNVFIVQAVKNSWRIPDGVEIPVYMTFDNSQPYPAKGTGYVRDGKNFVQFSVANKFSLNFLNLLANADRMTLGFTEGTEPPWTTSMRGSREAVASFESCILKIDPPATPPTQPYGQPQATQPYGNSNAPQATQPFGTKPTQSSAKPAKDNGSI